jgi:hypothetical protein
MVEFSIDSDLLKEFIEKCSMKGTIIFKSGSNVKKNLFNSFYLDVNPDGRLEVLAMDTVRKKTSIKAILNNVKVITSGVIPIIDSEAIIKVLGGRFRIDPYQFKYI